MRHIDDVQLQAYIDGELSPEACRMVEEHIAECQVCCAKLDDCQCLCSNVRALVPEDGLFRSEGEFWACLASRLKPACATSTWPWITSLPPVLLGSVGLVLNVFISVALALHALASLGITGSPGAALASWMTTALGASTLEPLFTALGWSQAAVIQRMMAACGVLGRAGQDFVLFALLIVLVGAILGTVLTMFFSWVFCTQGREAR